MKISFVIPCYRSEHTLRGVVDEIKATVLQRPAVDFEIVLVDDCSPDGVWNTITELVSENWTKGLIWYTESTLKSSKMRFVALEAGLIVK